jgi:hypothetical protein
MQMYVLDVIQWGRQIPPKFGVSSRFHFSWISHICFLSNGFIGIAYLPKGYPGHEMIQITNCDS